MVLAPGLGLACSCHPWVSKDGARDCGCTLMTRVRSVSAPANQRAVWHLTDQWEVCIMTPPWCILIMISGTSTLCILAKQERMNNKVIRGTRSPCIRTEELRCCSQEHFKLFKQTFADFRFAENSLKSTATLICFVSEIQHRHVLCNFSLNHLWFWKTFCRFKSWHIGWSQYYSIWLKVEDLRLVKGQFCLIWWHQCLGTDPISNSTLPHGKNQQ